MKRYTFFALVLAFFACKPPLEVIEPTIIVTDFSVIDGDTVKTRKEKDFKLIKDKDKDPNGRNLIVVGDTVVLYKAPKLHTPPAKDPDLSKLKNNDDPDLKGKPLRMVAIGGSLTAGVRDGGYFNEGILTSYPNLIARQMKLKKFEQPLFDAQDYNGFGRKVRTGENWTGGPVPKFKAADNNSGVEYVDEKEVKLKKYKEKDALDNWSFPHLTVNRIDFPIMLTSDAWKSYLARIDKVDRKEKNLILTEQLLKEKFDLFIIDITDGFKYRPNGYVEPVEELLKVFSERKLKGCLLNIPNEYDRPLYKIIEPSSLKKVEGYHYFFPNVFDLNGNQVQKDLWIKPSSTLDSLLGSHVSLTLKPKTLPTRTITTLNDIYSYNNFLIEENKKVTSYSFKYQFPVVDVYGLYKKIREGSYITEDGVRVDGSINGNFFSSDMRNPSAFGQAVIANEVIRSLNATYKTEIPLIKISEYLDK